MFSNFSTRILTSEQNVVSIEQTIENDENDRVGDSYEYIDYSPIILSASFSSLFEASSKEISGIQHEGNKILDRVNEGYVHLERIMHTKRVGAGEVEVIRAVWRRNGKSAEGRKKVRTLPRFPFLTRIPRRNGGERRGSPMYGTRRKKKTLFVPR